MQKVAEVLAKAAAGGEPMVVARVIEVEGFSTLPVDELVAIDRLGRITGELLGRPGEEAMVPMAMELLDSSPGRLARVDVTVGGSSVEELGLTCGGRVGVLLQPARAIPVEAWSALAARSPVALVTMLEGPDGNPDAIAVSPDGSSCGRLAVGAKSVQGALVEEAQRILSEGVTARRSVETLLGQALIEAWVPSPRIVVVGAGEVVTAIESQSALLGWEVRHTAGHETVTEMLEWAGTTAALVVLSHDPHVDVPALAAGLATPISYVGAMGSRHTQSRRTDRLAAAGVSEDDLARIHRPIGLDLGGRRAPEIALAIAAEIQAVMHNRDAKSLRDSSGPIHRS